jgi:hypothetical protein
MFNFSKIFSSKGRITPNLKNIAYAATAIAVTGYI